MRPKMRTTAILVFHKVGHILRQKRDNIPTIQEPGRGDMWGGHCTAGEMHAACAIRALREEIGVEIADPQAFKFLMTRLVDGREEFLFAYVFDADGTPPSLGGRARGVVCSRGSSQHGNGLWKRKALRTRGGGAGQGRTLPRMIDELDSTVKKASLRGLAFRILTDHLFAKIRQNSYSV